MSNKWHGYEQHEDAVEARPWWRLSSRGLCRADGVKPFSAASDWKPEGYQDWWGWDGREALDTVMARIDREHPLPMPPRKCGQVWVHADGTEEMITIAGPHNRRPPPGAVLVAGPGSPWADTRSPSVSEPVTDRRACGRCGWQGVERDVVDQRCPQCGTIGGVVVSYVRRAEVTP